MERTNTRLIAAFAATLRARRKAAGLSQEELAARSELSARFISFLETERRQPTLTVVAALSDALGLRLADFAAEIDANRFGQDQ